MEVKIKLFWLISILFIYSKSESLAQINNEYGEKHLTIVLRDIGHQLLLNAKDSTSRVMPIKKIAENIFQIEFQSQISFVTDTLINLVYSRLKAKKLPAEYIVSVLNCGNLDLIYGYEVSKKTGNIIPCTGRSQPKGCYIIQIQFLAETKNNCSAFLILLIPIVFFGYFIKKKYLAKNKILFIDNEPFIAINKLKFYQNQNKLTFNKETIELSGKETKLLDIFAKNINRTVDRELLLKEIWENDGTIVVTRSLDVLVSKLRKKVEIDPNVKLVNVHGKGYKLVTGEFENI